MHQPMRASADEVMEFLGTSLAAPPRDSALGRGSGAVTAREDSLGPERVSLRFVVVVVVFHPGNKNESDLVSSFREE